MWKMSVAWRQPRFVWVLLFWLFGALFNPVVLVVALVRGTGSLENIPGAFWLWVGVPVTVGMLLGLWLFRGKTDLTERDVFVTTLKSAGWTLVLIPFVVATAAAGSIFLGDLNEELPLATRLLEPLAAYPLFMGFGLIFGAMIALVVTPVAYCLFRLVCFQRV